MRNRYRLALAVLFVLCSCAVVAQEATPSPLSVGIRGGALYQFNKSSIPVILGSTDCGTFADGTSLGYYGGLEVNYAVLGSFLELCGGVTYANRPASLQHNSTDNFEVLDPRSNEYVRLVRQHDFTATLGYVMVEVGVQLHPLEAIPLCVRLTADAGNPIVGNTYNQTEMIVSPDGVLFPDGLQRRTTGSGPFPGLGTSYGVSGGLGYVIDLSKNFQLIPQVSYRYGLNNLTTEATWRQDWVSAGLYLRYRFTEAAPPPPPPPPPPPLPPPVVEATPEPVTIVALSTNPLTVQETVVTQTFPLLPYVFFDSASSALPPKYVGTEPTSAFSEAKLPRETLPIYHKMLDVIGKRMSENSSAKLVVTGTSDGAERATLADRRSLAQERASAVATYIQQRWGIAPDRFVVRTQDKPSLTSNEMYAEGIQENRRVELDASDPLLLAPIVHSRFMEYVATQPTQVFRARVEHPERVKSWRLLVKHHGREVATRAHSGVPPSEVTFNLDQELTNQIGPLVGSTDTLDATLIVDEHGGSTAAGSTRFGIHKTTNQFEVSRLSLIVFDYDKSDISKQNLSMMQRVIQAAVRDGSTATITGSTDKLGELRHNVDLSTARAKTVERAAQSIAPSLAITKVEGIGPSILPYDNSLPEGRFYCRTVSLTITTPLR